MVNLRNKAWRRFCNKGKYCKSEYINYKKVRNLANRKLKKAVRKHERSILKNAKFNPKVVFKYINRKNPPIRGIKSLRLSDNSLTSDQLKIANELNNYFSSVFSEKHTGQLPEFTKRTDKTCDLDINRDLDVNEIKTRLSKLNVHKSCGPGGISAYFLYRCSNSIPYRSSNSYSHLKKIIKKDRYPLTSLSDLHAKLDKSRSIAVNDFIVNLVLMSNYPC